MDEKTFQNYQKRLLEATKKLNEQSDDPFTKSCKILDNLKKFVLNGTFSQVKFQQETEKQFNSIVPLDEASASIKRNLMDFCSNRNEALETISELYNFIKPMAVQIGSVPVIRRITMECLEEVKRDIFHSK